MYSTYLDSILSTLIDPMESNQGQKDISLMTKKEHRSQDAIRQLSYWMPERAKNNVLREVETSTSVRRIARGGVVSFNGWCHEPTFWIYDESALDVQNFKIGPKSAKTDKEKPWIEFWHHSMREEKTPQLPVRGSKRGKIVDNTHRHGLI